MVDDAALHFEVKRVVTREPEPALGWAGRCEAAYLESAFGKAPIAGMFGSCEIGPIGTRSELLTHTGVLALLDR